MMDPAQQFVLGSRSPRRRELLEWIVPADRIAAIPPADAAEPGFDQLHEWNAIDRQLSEIAAAKCRDVLKQIIPQETAAVITADTIIVAESLNGELIVLGQPPETDDWQTTVRHWFRDYLLGRWHTAATAVCVTVPNGTTIEQIVKTRVRFDAASEALIEWYLATGEPRGKAGGYAIQGAGSLFVSQVEGSLSNVVGLPIRELRDMLEELGLVA